MATTRGATFTTTHWVIYRVHCNTTNTWTTPEPTTATRLSKTLIVMLQITYLSDSCPATSIQEADLP
jgi:hypothetical protein